MGFVSKKNFSNKQNEITLNKKTFEPKKVFLIFDILTFLIIRKASIFSKMKWNGILFWKWRHLVQIGDISGPTPGLTSDSPSQTSEVRSRQLQTWFSLVRLSQMVGWFIIFTPASLLSRGEKTLMLTQEILIKWDPRYFTKMFF